MGKVTTTERGWAGHFCCARQCLFRRNTLVRKDGVGVVVSTVGNYRTLGKNGFEMIGCDRYYETLVFKANMSDVYFDADIAEQVNFNSPWAISDVNGDVDNRANAMHETVVKEIVGRMKAGEFDPETEK